MPSPPFEIMDPSNILFETISNLTGGLIADLQTAFLGILVLGFIAMAVDYITAPLQESFKLRRENADAERDYQEYAEKRRKREWMQNRYLIERELKK